jgi:hypothetical protein
MTDELETLLQVQEQDLALDRLRHRRETLPVRAELDGARRDLSTRVADLSVVQRERDEVLAEEERLDRDAESLGKHADEVDAKLYSGTVTSPRELQALQTDLDMLRRRRREIEDAELEVMERREMLDARIASTTASVETLQAHIAELEAALAGQEAEIDAEIDAELATRARHAAVVSDALLRDYEGRRARNRGAGAARLVGTTCQACHLSIPSTEAERIRRAGGTEPAYCDNCGAILVP